LSIELVENHTSERTSKNRPTLIQPNRKDECCNHAGIQIQKDEILLRVINTQFDLLLKEKLSQQGLKSRSSDPRVKKSSAPKGEPVTAACSRTQNENQSGEANPCRGKSHRASSSTDPRERKTRLIVGNRK
jgi:hypothetical protein